MLQTCISSTVCVFTSQREKVSRVEILHSVSFPMEESICAYFSLTVYNFDHFQKRAISKLKKSNLALRKKLSLTKVQNE